MDIRLLLGLALQPLRRMKSVFAIVLVTIALLSSFPVVAAERMHTAYQSLSIGSSTAIWVAKEAGFFDAQGLDVKIVFVEGSPRTIQTLIAGESEIVESTGPSVLNARAAGSPVVVVAGFINVMPYYLIATPGIDSPADLKGKIGANNLPGTAADTVMRIGLKALGLDPDRDVSLRTIGNVPFRLQAMAAGAAQFMVGQDLELEQAKKLGFKVLVDYVAKQTPFQMGAAVTSERYAREKSDVVLRYVKALAQALNYLKTNRDGSIAIIGRYARAIKSDVIAAAYDNVRRLFNDTPMPTPEGMNFIAGELAQRNPKIREVKPASVFDLEFVEELERSGFLKALKGS